MSDFNIRDVIRGSGFDSVSDFEKKVAEKMKTADASNQLELIELQSDMQKYTNTISLMSTMLKSLADTDKEIIRAI